MTWVSVIIPTFNRAQTLLRALSSILYQTFFDYEIIVVDDGSSDDTPGRLAPFHDHIRCISHDHNLGVSAARNTGIKAANSPFIAFLDSDDYWLPQKLAAQAAFFNKNPEAVACQTEEIWIRNGVRVNPQRKHRKPSGDIYIPSLKLCLVSPSAVVVKKSLFDEVGLFDEDLPACEDYDLWLRISCHYPIYLLEESFVVKVGGHEDQLSSAHPGMDRFRIQAMVKMIESGKLREHQLVATLFEMKEKCRIYGNGCVRRGREEEGKYYLELPEKIEKDLMLY